MDAPAQAPHDPAMQPERTNLAWRRTILALVVGALGGLRVTWTAQPLLSGVAAAVLIGSLGVLLVARRSYRRAHATLATASARFPSGDGVLPAAVAALVGFCAVVAMAMVLIEAVPALAP